jgi:hypothetical protein
VLAIVAFATGCGARGPQAPGPEANRVASALEGISQACGESYQQSALPRFGAPNAGPRQAAAMRALELARVVRAYPQRIYQNETLTEVAHLAGERLRECGLAAVADELHRLIAGAR